MPRKTKSLPAVQKPISKPGAAKKSGNGTKAEGVKKVIRGLNGGSEPRLAKEPVPLEDLHARKFVLNPPPPPPEHEVPAYEYLGELPDAYGTKKLYLVARDPYFLFAYWDLSWQQYQEAAERAHDGKVFLQIYLKEGGHRVQQIHVGDGVRNFYAQVNQPGTAFYAELGFYRQDGGFEVISRSGDAETPPDSMSWKTEARFVTIPFPLSFRQLWDLIRAVTRPGEELAEALARLQEEGFEFPFQTPKGSPLGEEQHEALLEYLGGELVRRIQVGSLEITEVLRRRMTELQSSGQWLSSISSPFGASFGARGGERNFHMHVNAELIIYGGTDPKAKVRIDGQEISLRQDGTFSYHFNFPDGKFHIPVEAVSPDGVEMRSALLSFLRISDYAGDVRKTGQPPLPEPIGRTR